MFIGWCSLIGYTQKVCILIDNNLAIHHQCIKKSMILHTQFAQFLNFFYIQNACDSELLVYGPDLGLRCE